MNARDPDCDVVEIVAVTGAALCFIVAVVWIAWIHGNAMMAGAGVSEADAAMRECGR